jgi:transcriptional regulator with XRE-family HTH domain
MQAWMETTGVAQREFAADLQKTQVWLQKILSGENHVRLKDLDDVAHAMRTTASELVRSEADRYQLELTPTEVRILENLRRRPDMLTAVASFLKITVPVARDYPVTREPVKQPSRKRKGDRV